MASTLMLFIASLLSGCSSGNMPELGQVSGRVTLDGQPLAGVEISFHPLEGRPAFGTTDADGGYSLNYKLETPGCKVGANRVRIGNAEESDEAETEGDEGVQTTGKQRPVIHARYNDKSELEREVKPGDNTFDFDLTSEAVVNSKPQ